MAAYTRDQYKFIVEQLAEGETSAAIIAEFARRWKDTACTIDDVAACERPYLNADWRGYFDVHRAAFEASAPSASSEFRIALLDKWAREAAGRGARDLAAKHLEQIAKEQAGFYAGKSKAEATPAANSDPIVAITRTIVDPRAPDAI